MELVQCLNRLWNPQMGLNNFHMGLNHSLQGLNIPQMGLMMRSFYFPKQWSGHSQQRWEVFLLAASSTNSAAWRHIWKLPILPGWHVLRKLWHMKKVPCKKFIMIRKQLVYSPKWSRNQQLPFALNREAWTFFRACFNIFQKTQFPRQLYRLDQWQCFVWSTKLWMFVKEMFVHEECRFHKINV